MATYSMHVDPLQERPCLLSAFLNPGLFKPKNVFNVLEQSWYWNRNGYDNLKEVIYKSWLCFLVKSIDFEEVSHSEDADSLYFVHCEFTT